VLGFPIRTPPDHSLVANSPGLIAGSNVLHRLLMPRHPPCALHSLSQQRQDNTHKETTPAHPPIKEADQLIDATRQEKQATPELILELIELLATSHNPTGRTQQGWGGCEDARVHYADLKQQPHQHPRPPTRATSSKGRTRTTNQQTADPSGPNSVPDPIPHQRRAMSNQQAGHRRFH
jgi:hypothetical protein